MIHGDTDLARHIAYVISQNGEENTLGYINILEKHVLDERDVLL